MKVVIMKVIKRMSYFSHSIGLTRIIQKGTVIACFNMLVNC
jgi:hypothetical protein